MPTSHTLFLLGALESIDWSYYSSRVGDPSIVDDFKAKYAGVSIPRPEDTTSASIGALEADFKKDVSGI